MMNDDISQLSPLRLYSHKQYCPLTCRSLAFYAAFTIKESAARFGLTGSQFIACNPQCDPITGSAYDCIKGKIHNLPKETSLLHTNMRHATGGRIKTHMGKRTFFTIRAKYFPAKMKFLHLGDQRCSVHVATSPGII